MSMILTWLATVLRRGVAGRTSSISSRCSGDGWKFVTFIATWFSSQLRRCSWRRRNGGRWICYNRLLFNCRHRFYMGFVLDRLGAFICWYDVVDGYRNYSENKDKSSYNSIIYLKELERKLFSVPSRTNRMSDRRKKSGSEDCCTGKSVTRSIYIGCDK